MAEADSLFDIAKNSTMYPVDRDSVPLPNTPNEQFENTIKRNALSFPANDLLKLTTEEVYDLSRLIRKRFTAIASQYHLKTDPFAMEMMKNGENNTLIHELAHIRVVEKLRPEAIHGATINFLPLLDGNQLKLGTNVMYTTPEIPYTTLERATILLEPFRPSEADYYELFQIIQTTNKDEDREAIISLVSNKPKSIWKEKLTKLLTKP